MEKQLKVTHHFEAPMEHVGGALERYVAGSDAWQSSVIDREGGTLVLMLRSGWAPWVDQVTVELETRAPGTTELRLRLERSLRFSREAPRRRHIAALLEGVNQLVSK